MKRIDCIINEIKGKNVLDIGSNDMDNSSFLFKNMKKSAKRIVGVDIKKGQNFEIYNVGKKFDIIVAGEVIEHLNNPGLFLLNCEKHLKKSGKLIITTPNSLNIERMIKHFLIGKYRPDVFKNNPEEHTLYFTKEVLERLLFRHKFEVEKFFYVNHEIQDRRFRGSTRPNMAKIIHNVKNIFKNIRPHFRDTMFIVAKLKQ